jgi:hypothetical protein
MIPDGVIANDFAALNEPISPAGIRVWAKSENKPGSDIIEKNDLIFILYSIPSNPLSDKNLSPFF